MICFIGGMVESVNQVYNPRIKNPPLRVGVLDAPDAHYRPVLYSHTQATKQFNDLSVDIYKRQCATKPEDRHKTPKSIICALIVGAVAILLPLLKKHLM